MPRHHSWRAAVEDLCSHLESAICLSPDSWTSLIVAGCLCAGGYKERLEAGEFLFHRKKGDSGKVTASSYWAISHVSSVLSCVYHLSEVHTSCVINIPVSSYKETEVQRGDMDPPTPQWWRLIWTQHLDPWGHINSMPPISCSEGDTNSPVIIIKVIHNLKYKNLTLVIFAPRRNGERNSAMQF